MGPTTHPTRTGPCGLRCALPHGSHIPVTNGSLGVFWKAPHVFVCVWGGGVVREEGGGDSGTRLAPPPLRLLYSFLGRGEALE